MPQGFGQPTSNSAAHTDSAAFREQARQLQTGRTRQGRSEAYVPISAEQPNRPRSISSEPNTNSPPNLTVLYQASETQLSSHVGYKYYINTAQDKHPHGQVLDRIGHPYQEPRATALAGRTPSPIDACIEERSLASSAFEPKGESSIQEPASHLKGQPWHSQAALPSSRQPKLVSVRSAKNFFENKSSQTPLATTTGANSASLKRHPSTSSRDSSTLDPSPETTHTAKTRFVPTNESEASDTADKNAPSTMEDVTSPTGSPLRSLTKPEAEAVRSVTHSDVEVGESVPEVVIRSATRVTDVAPQEDDQSVSETDDNSTNSIESTNIFSDPSRNATDDRPALHSIAKLSLIVDKEAKSDYGLGPPDKLMRHLSTRRSMSDIKTTQAQTLSRQQLQLGSQRARSYRDIRTAFEEHREFIPKSAMERESRSTHLTEGCGTLDEANHPSIRRRLSKKSSPNFEIFRDRFGKHVDVRKRSEVNVSKGLGYDGSHSPNLSRRNTTSSPIPTINIGIGALHQNNEAPNHMDNRQGYGRRVRNVTIRILPEMHTDCVYQHLDDPRLWLPRCTYQISWRDQIE